MDIGKLSQQSPAVGTLGEMLVQSLLFLLRQQAVQRQADQIQKTLAALHTGFTSFPFVLWV